MAFSWTQDISKGAKIDAVDLLEIRTNIDTVDDEKCAAHKVSYDSDYKDGDDTPHYTGYDSGQQSSYYGGYLSGYDAEDYPGYKHTYYTLYKSSYKVSFV
ncbi:unnamed protein product [marine sediment metagenome]|uniref:Uncharacterized protein n=1 Tax=marine sediment metagenome TaxID=412755 RepID=X1RHF8_9ZZZZ